MADEKTTKRDERKPMKNPITMDAIREYVRGEITLQELNQIHPDEMIAIAKLGEAMIETGKFDQARVIFEGLAELNPYIGHYHTVLGGVYLRLGEFDNAVKEYTKSIKCNPNDVAAYANRGEIYLRQGKVEEASRDLAKAIELDKETDPSKKNPSAMRAIVLAMVLNEAIEEAQRKQQS